MRFSSILLLVLGLVARPAQAQDWVFNPDLHGEVQARACPVEDGDTGNYLCVMAGCEQGQPLRWRLVAEGGNLPDPLRVNVFVDEVPSGFLSLRQVQSEVPFDFQAQVDPERDVRMIDALKGGNSATLVLDPEGAAIEVPLSLKGSSKAISSAEGMCPKRPAAVSDPVKTVLDSLKTECADLGGTLEMVGGFERQEDLDGDGQKDVVIEYGGAPCTTALSLHCGSGGCVSDVYMKRANGYVRAWSDVVRDILNEPGEPTVAISVHGSACELAGVESCVLRVDMSQDPAQVVEKLSGAAADAWVEKMVEAETEQ